MGCSLLCKIVVDFLNSPHDERLVFLPLCICVFPEVTKPVVVWVLLYHLSEFCPGNPSDRESETEASIEHILCHKLRIEYAADIIFVELSVCLEHLHDLIV